MTDLLVTRGASCDHTHPPPVGTVDGTISQFQSTNVSVVVGNTGNKRQLATAATANMDFTDDHKQVPDKSERCSTVTINSSDIFLKRSGVTSNANITGSGSNSTITFSPS